MTEVRDPGPDTADRILDGLERFIWKPSEVARSARRLRAHIKALRQEIVDLNSGRLYAPDLAAIAGKPVSALKSITAGKRRFDPTGSK